MRSPAPLAASLLLLAFAQDADAAPPDTVPASDAPPAVAVSSPPSGQTAPYVPPPYVRPSFSAVGAAAGGATLSGDSRTNVTAGRILSGTLIGLAAPLAGLGVYVLATNHCAPNDDRCDSASVEFGNAFGGLFVAVGGLGVAAGSIGLWQAAKMSDRLDRAEVSLVPWSVQGAEGLALTGRF
jgi:hypothetical protein